MSKKKDELKKRLKRRKAREDRRQRLSDDEQPQRSAIAAELLDRAARKETPVPTDPHQRWWYDFRRADANGKLQMVREKLPVAEDDLQQRERYFPDALDELANALSIEEHAGLLEEIRLGYPQLFDSELEWNLYFLSYRYVDEERWETLDDLTGHFAEQLTKIGSTYFPLVSLLRLAGRDTVAERLIEAGLRCLDPDDLLPWAMNDLFDWATFSLYERCVGEGEAEETFAEIDRRAVLMGATPSETTRQAQREIVHRKRGEGEAWTRAELRSDDGDLAQKSYFLYFDYARWLGEKHRLPPVVADELRVLLPNAFEGRNWHVNGFLDGIDRQGFDSCLRRYLGPMSLNRVRGPATVIAMHSFFDFLYESDLVDAPVRKSSQLVCTDLWADLRRMLGRNWMNYRFLEKCWPEKTAHG